MTCSGNWIRRLSAGLLAVALVAPAGAQVVMQGERASLTLEAWANGVVTAGADGARADDEAWQTDGALRGLALVRLTGFGRLGARVVAEARGGVDDDLDAGERSLIWTGTLGRLEYGERQGLPDVLTGYAPNPFTFTTAEFGPASGLALDPGGGIVQRFIPDRAAEAHDTLSVLGYGTSLFGDRSRKLLYVSPKRGGWLAGLSYAGGQDLLQAGVVHETYRGQNALRIGGAWARLGTDDEDLDSFLAGVTLDLDQTWLLGLAATWNPDESDSPVPGWRSDAFGVTASVNYNRGRWTIGGYLQDAQGRDAEDVERQRLLAAEAGISYRTSTKLRIFTAWYHYRIDGRSDLPADSDDLLIAGVRITL